MNGHRCPTGFHVEPSANCYQSRGHGCRCTGCKNAKLKRDVARPDPPATAEFNRAADVIAGRIPTTVPTDAWLTIVRACQTEHKSIDAFVNVLGRAVATHGLEGVARRLAA